MSAYTVGQVARLAGVSIRTLHHYHHIGLLEPSGHSRAGYREYADTDLERLQRVLFYKERSEEHTSELQSQSKLVCRLLLEKKKGHLVTACLHRPWRRAEATPQFGGSEEGGRRQFEIGGVHREVRRRFLDQGCAGGRLTNHSLAHSHADILVFLRQMIDQVFVHVVAYGWRG